MVPKILLFFTLTVIFGTYFVSCRDIFDIELFQRLSGRGTSNVLISPVSIKLLLAMIMEGAVNETSEEIRTALRLPQQRDLAEQKIRKWKTPLTKKSNGPDVVKMAFHIFLDHEYSFKSQYRTSLRQYDADIAVVKKEDPEGTSRIINDWVEKETSGMIPSIISPRDVDRSFVMAEANVVYFKGIWKYFFKPENTKEECFYKKQMIPYCQKIPMMSMNNVRLKFVHDGALNATAVDIPYKDGEHSMLILLPDKRNGVDRLLADLLLNSLDCIVSTMRNTNVNLKIPKFSLEYSNYDVISTLKSMNILRAFSKDAQLYNMVNERENLHVSKIFQKTKIVVSEEGTEAGVASLGTTGLVKSLETATDFIADHPFLYFIRDDNNIVLFAGKYNGL